MTLQGKVAVITGAASGIGAATALLFAREGARVVLGDRAPMDAVLEQLRAAGGHAVALQTDVANAADTTALLQAAVDTFGGLDILVNNAGIGTDGNVETVDEEVLDRVWAVNFKGALRLCRGALPLMRKRGESAILFTTALAGMYGMANAVAYATSKAAIINMCKAMALEFGRDGVRSNCVSPGPVDTPMLEGAIQAFGLSRDMFRAISPTGRITQAEDVANALLFLASPAARSINGHVLVVDNGMYAGMFQPRPVAPAAN